jgi:hypothetical protein
VLFTVGCHGSQLQLGLSFDASISASMSAFVAPLRPGARDAVRALVLTNGTETSGKKDSSPTPSSNGREAPLPLRV